MSSIEYGMYEELTNLNGTYEERQRFWRGRSLSGTDGRFWSGRS